MNHVSNVAYFFSDAGSSDDEFGLRGDRSCECVIQ